MVRTKKLDPDRHLISRRGIYHYKRRVPAVVADLDPRVPHVRVSLKTSDIEAARVKRDALDNENHAYWASLLLQDADATAETLFETAVAQAAACGFKYMTANELVSQQDLHEVLGRVQWLKTHRHTPRIAQAIFGFFDRPGVSVTAASQIYIDEIVHDELRGKSNTQRQSWKKVKQRAVDNFVALAGDKGMLEVTRDDAQKLYHFWLDRIAPKSGAPTHQATSGNRDLGNMRVLFDEYFKHMGIELAQNPFDGLSFSEKRKRSRPPIAVDWIKNQLMRVGALSGINAQARGVVLAMIETGARPSELCNLTRDEIFLDADVPYIRVEPREDVDNPREIKTDSSVRSIPLVGVALAVFKKHPNGFPRYLDKENSLTTAINKFLRENKLLPTPKHTFYSLRHSFEDRMKEGGLDEELRRGLMGHTIPRPKYGSGGALAWQRDELTKIALPFDPAIV